MELKGTPAKGRDFWPNVTYFSAPKTTKNEKNRLKWHILGAAGAKNLEFFADLIKIHPFCEYLWFYCIKMHSYH